MKRLEKKQELSPNMTERKLEEITEVLPDKMTGAELCALTLTIHSIFIDEPDDIAVALINNVYTFGSSTGMSVRAISDMLRETADKVDKDWRVQ